MRRKVLHIITGLSVGGAERALANILAGGLANICDNQVLSLIEPGPISKKIEELGVSVTTLSMTTDANIFRYYPELLRTIRLFRPDVIHGWMYHGNIVASIAGMHMRSARVLWNVRHCLYDINRERAQTRQVIRLNKLLSGTVSSIVYNSVVSKRQHEEYGFNSRKSLAIPNGYDAAKIRFNQSSRDLVRSECHFEDCHIVVGHVARFHPMKDHKTFVSAAVRVARADPRVRFLMLGRDVSYDNQSLTELIPADQVDKFVMLGERSEVAHFMSGMDVFCLSSWSEAFPNVLAEAMLCGLPCISTKVGDSESILGDGGILVEPQSISALEKAINIMLMKSAHEQQDMGRVNRNRVVSRYSISSVIDQYSALYD